MIKKLFSPGGLLSTSLLVVVLGALAVSRHQVLALLAVAAIEFYVWWRRPHSSVVLAADTYEYWLASLSAVVLVAVSPQLVSQILIIAAFAVWRLWITLADTAKYSGLRALAMQFVSLVALFTAVAVWRWPAALVMILAWGSSWLVARSFLIHMQDEQVTLLAGVWALVVAELAWILSWWVISYVSPGAYLIIPQAALLIAGVGYVLGGIYRLHRTSQLSRSRLIEYLVVAAALLAIILAGSRWNGTT